MPKKSNIKRKSPKAVNRTRTIAIPVLPEEENNNVKIKVSFALLAVVFIFSLASVLGSFLSVAGENYFGPYAVALADFELRFFGKFPLFLLGLSAIFLLIYLGAKLPKTPKELKFQFGSWATGCVLLFVFFSVILAVKDPSEMQNLNFEKSPYDLMAGFVGTLLRKKVFPPIFGQNTEGVFIIALGGIALTAFFCFGLKVRHLLFIAKKIKLQFQKLLYFMEFRNAPPPPITRPVRIADTGDFEIVQKGMVKPAKGSPFGKSDLTKYRKEAADKTGVGNFASESGLQKEETSFSDLDAIAEIQRQLALAQEQGKDPREIRRLRDELLDLRRIKDINRWEDEKGESLEIGGLLGKKTEKIFNDGAEELRTIPVNYEKDDGDESGGSEQQSASEGETSPPIKRELTIIPKEPTQYDEYRVPLPFEILSAVPDQAVDYTEDELQKIGKNIESQLDNFKVKGKVTGIMTGPVITRFEIEPGPGVKVSRFENLSDDLALTLKVQSARVITSIPGKSAIGIEIPNRKPQTVFCREILESSKFTKDPKRIQVVLGKDIMGDAFVTDLTKTPHLLIAGQTGAGKSVCINVLLASILFSKTPDEVRLILIDPKVVELAMYGKIPHLLHPVINSPEVAVQALKWLCVEMDRRYEVLATAKVRNIEGFNDKFRAGELGEDVDEGERKLMPFVVVIIDELADLMMTAGKEIETSIARIAQKARAVGIHLVLATQKPVRTVITGIIKANLPSRISFKVSSQIDSRIVFDANGAEKLLGRGDMLFRSNSDPDPVRVHGAFLSDPEVERLAAACANQNVHYEQVESFDLGEGEEGDENEAGFDSPQNRDPLFWQAAHFGLETGAISISAMQRRLGIGFSRAGRLADQLTAAGICDKARGSKSRKMLMDEEMVNNLERR